jgi:antitoxin component of RelBE/YafQ-DinJ toxin-antitoxin module
MLKIMEKRTENPAAPKTLQVRMTVGEIEKAKERAEKTGLSLSQVVRKLLNDFASDPQPRLIFG